MKKSLILWILVIVGTVWAQGSVTVYNPDGSFNCATDTIQWGINACLNGGTVTVADGTYTGASNRNLTWIGKHITVKSVNGPSNCIIDCEHSEKGFYFNNTGQNRSGLIFICQKTNV
jgi:hypothetical protein